MQEATFCDWLINRGVGFHPDTVIVNADAIRKDKSYIGTNLLNIADPTKPIFQYMVFESLFANGNGQVAVYICPPTDLIFERNPEIQDMEFNTARKKIGSFRTSYVQGTIFHFSSNVRSVKTGEVKPYAGGFLAFNNGGFFVDCVNQNGGEINSSNSHDFAYILCLTLIVRSGYYFYQRKEIELVEQPRPKARRILRQTKKLPSPYFRIIDASDKPQKRYTGSGVSTGRKLDKAHIVRGHFRHTQDHPIAQFNGTFWIPSHVKGKGENAPPPRYKIILRDDNAKTK